jgi:uncharacterized SAM-binding protein YcdF (DUF218 family)
MQNTINTKVSKKIKLIRATLCAAFLLIGLWVFGLVKYVDNLPVRGNIDSSITDGIVIFTGGSMRLEKGVELLKKGVAEKLFVSGVGKRANLDNILMLSGELPDNILELKDKIDLGYEAQDTRGNAIEVIKWVKSNDYKSIRLVTANYHMPRSYFELTDKMPELKVIKNPVFPKEIKINKWWRHGITKKIMISEYNKYIVRRIFAIFGM